MASPIRIHSLSPPLDSLPTPLRTKLEMYPDPDGEDLDLDDLETFLEGIGELAPSLELQVVYEAENYAFDLAAKGIRNGKIWHQHFQLSRKSDRFDPAPKAIWPNMTLTLDVEADQLIDRIIRATDAVGSAASGNLLKLPLQWRDPSVLALLAGHMIDASANCAIMIDREYFAVDLARGDVAIVTPLFVWHDDEVLRRAGREAITQSRSGTFAAPSMRIETHEEWDPNRPLTTGAATRRLREAEALMPVLTTRHAGWTSSSSVEPTSPALMEIFVAAARDPSNAGLDFVVVRMQIYQQLAKWKSIEAGRALIALLEHERDPEARFALLRLIALRRGKNPGRTLVRFYRDEPELRPRVGQLLWKHEAAVELLVREELLPKWNTNRSYADGIVRLLRSELIPVPGEWLEGADPSLRDALGSAVR